MVEKTLLLQTFIYFIILKRSFGTIIIENKKFSSSTISVSEEVKKEISILNALLEKIRNSPSQQEAAVAQGKVLGRFEEMIKQCAKERKTADERITDMDKADMYQLLLALTSRVDTLEKMLAPGKDFKGQPRAKRWTYIFSLNTPAVEDIRSKVYAAGMTETSFIEEIERLMHELNTRAPHVNVPLPKLISEKAIEGALRILEITDDDDDKAIETVKILIKPVRGGDFIPTKKP